VLFLVRETLSEDKLRFSALVCIKN